MGLGVVVRGGPWACLSSSSFDFVDGRDRTEVRPRYSDGESCIGESKTDERCCELRVSVLVSRLGLNCGWRVGEVMILDAHCSRCGT